MSRKIAFGGILTALCVVILYFAGNMPTGRLGLYALASVIIAVSVIEIDIRSGAIVYAATALLTFLLVGNVNAAILFLLFFGSYPLLKYYIEKQRNPVTEMLMKFAIFNLLALAAYFSFKLLLGIDPIQIQAFSPMVLLGGAVAAQGIFLLYDYVLSRLISYYVNRIRSVRR